MRGIWKPLLISGAVTPVMTSCTDAEAGLTICLFCAMAALLAYACEAAPEAPAPAPVMRRLGLLAVLAYGSVPVIGWLDYLTGYAVDVTVLYFLPIGLAAWRLSAIQAALAVVLSTGVWLAAHLLARHDTATSVVLWNAIVIFMSFALIAGLLRRERTYRERLADYDARIGHQPPMPGVDGRPRRGGSFDRLEPTPARVQR